MLGHEETGSESTLTLTLSLMKCFFFLSRQKIYGVSVARIITGSNNCGHSQLCLICIYVSIGVTISVTFKNYFVGDHMEDWLIFSVSKLGASMYLRIA